MGSLDRSQKKYLIGKFRIYRDIDTLINKRKMYLETNKEQGERVGSSSGVISKIPEQLVIKYDEDIKLNNYYLIKRSVEACLEELDENHRKLFNELWMVRVNEGYNIEDIGLGFFGYSKSKTYRMVDNILKIYAEILGYP